MGSILGGGKEKKTSSSKSSSSTKVVLPDYLKDIVPGLVDRINQASMTPYQPYTGQRISPFNQDQLSAFAGIRGLQGQYQPLINSAAANSITNGQGITGNDISQFMNPYNQNVTDINKREALRDFDVQMNRIGDSAASVGAFGGDRHGVIESNAYRDLNQNLQDIENTGNQQGYQTATSTALANAQLKQSGLAGMISAAHAGQDYGIKDLAALQQIGGQQQALGQSQNDFDYNQFVEQRGWPYQNAQFASSNLGPLIQMLSGSASSSKSESTQTSQQGMSPLQAIVGVGSMLAAPFTGGASLMGSLGGAGMSGLGSLIGGSSGLGGMLAGAGTGMQAGLNASQIFRMAQGGANGAYGPGFKAGGLVKKYAEGGTIDTNRHSLADLIRHIRGSGDDGFLPDDDAPTSNPMGDWMQKTKLYDMFKYFDTNNRLPPGPPMTGPGSDKDLKQQFGKVDDQHRLENTILAKAKPDEFGFLAGKPYRDMSPDEKALEALNNKLKGIAGDLGVPHIFDTNEDVSTKDEVYGPAEKTAANDYMSLIQKALPEFGDQGVSDADKWLNIGAAILGADPSMPGLSAVGEGVKAYLGQKKQATSDEMSLKQQDFENMLKVLNARQYALQNELATKRLAFETEMQPLKKGQLAAKIAQMQNQATNSGDKLWQKAVTMATQKYNASSRAYGDDPEAADAAIKQQAQQFYTLLQAQGGTPEGTQEGSTAEDPIGLRSLIQ